MCYYLYAKKNNKNLYISYFYWATIRNHVKNLLKKIEEKAEGLTFF